MKLTDFEALTFDCYGTLIDWESGILAAIAPLRSKCSSRMSDDDVLAAHGAIETAQQQQTPAMPYPRILATVYRRLAELWNVSVTWDECVRYGQSVKDWPAFPDSAEALRYLSQHYRLFILSNVDNESFSASNAKLGIDFDGIYTAEDIGTYKPAETNFSYMLDNLSKLGVDKTNILHTAESLYHDHVPANTIGLRSCWINRRQGSDGGGASGRPEKMPSTDFQFESMAEFVTEHRRATAL